MNGTRSSSAAAAATATATATATAGPTTATATVGLAAPAEPPYSAIAIVPGYTNTGPEMEPRGGFYASHGFVMIAARTNGNDQPSTRATKLLAAIDDLRAENQTMGSPLHGKLAGRFATSGYSMGGGGTTIASGRDPSLRSSVGLAAWGPETREVTVPTLLLCGTSDSTAPCSTSSSAYGSLPDATPKMLIEISGATHFAWFRPMGAGSGISGRYALAFMKVFLDGDERWRSLLTTPLASGGRITTNIR